MALFDDLPGWLGQMHQNPFTKFSRTCDLVEIHPDAKQPQHPNLGWVVIVATLLDFGHHTKFTSQNNSVAYLCTWIFPLILSNLHSTCLTGSWSCDPFLWTQPLIRYLKDRCCPRQIQGSHDAIGNINGWTYISIMWWMYTCGKIQRVTLEMNQMKHKRFFETYKVNMKNRCTPQKT